MSYPFKWNPVPQKVQETNEKLFGEGSNQLDCLISEPLGVFAPKAMKECAERVYNFEVRPDDVWIVTYPKCGTTWTQVRFEKVISSETFRFLHFSGNGLANCKQSGH